MTAGGIDVGDARAGRVARRRRLFGLAFLALPVTVFVTFAVAEGIGLAEGWWGHLIQLAVVLSMAAGAWFRPRIGGPVLILTGTLFTVLTLLANGGFEDRLPGVAIVFAPLIVAGVLFTLAGGSGTRAASHP